MAKFTIKQFREQFPTDDACLDYLFEAKFGARTGCPSCSVESKFKRVKNKRSYQCPICSFQIYPTAETVFHQTTTPLTYWFYAIYLFTTTRNGVAAKELERQLGVCYKTALRMAHQIKKLMMEDEEQKLMGEVIMDETFFGGRTPNKHKLERDILNSNGTGAINKTAAVFGMMEKGGRIITRVLDEPRINGATLKPIIRANVSPEAILVTDGHGAYSKLNKEFSAHHIIEHDKGIFVKDGFTTNNIENYWSTLKRMIKGTHIHVSKKHLPKYVAENTFRYVNRNEPEKMFEKILAKAK